MRERLAVSARALGSFAVLIAFFAVAAIGVRFAVSQGQAAEATARPGEHDVWTLQAGDCFNLTANGTLIAVSRAVVVGCGEPHRYEVVFADRLPAGNLPDDPAMQAWLRTSCAPAYEAYVGKSIAKSDLTVSYFAPDAAAWAAGTRTVQCAASERHGFPMTTSVRGARR